MMNTGFRVVAGAAALAALLAGGPAAFAQGPGAPRGGQRGPGGPGGAGLSGIDLRGADLTDVQREQIRALAEQYRETSQGVRDQLRQAQDAQREAVETVPVNEGLVRATMQALAQAQTDAALAQARFRADVMALLTPDQVQAIADRREQREERADQARERRQERRGRGEPDPQ